VLDKFRTLQQRGVTIIWTVHETLPHECPYPDVELEFRQSLVNLVDVVSVLHPATNAALDGAFTIPAEKILVVPHPLYTGAQADHVTRDAARADLGYGTSDLVMLSIGSIRPYKGYERVVRLMPSLQEQFGDSRLTYVIVGGRQQGLEINAYIEALEAEIELLPDPTAVRLVVESVPENYLHVLLRSADVAVAPYRQGLNSGVLLMNMTHGVPTVISSTVATESIAKFGPVSTFPVDDDNALREALIGRLTATATPTVDSQFIQENSPTAISAAFAQALRNRLRGTETESVLSQVIAGDGEK
jgi:glycosyltransferase involved in cell wall biosynthesis